MLVILQEVFRPVPSPVQGERENVIRIARVSDIHPHARRLDLAHTLHRHDRVIGRHDECQQAWPRHPFFNCRLGFRGYFHLRVLAYPLTSQASVLLAYVVKTPLDNNIAERALKKAILNRKNCLFYKTLKGAEVGDLYMSLIHTCELSGGNPVSYLTELLRHADELVLRPADWMPWNFQATLEPLQSKLA
jgi:Transposase IS66 family